MALWSKNRQALQQKVPKQVTENGRVAFAFDTFLWINLVTNNNLNTCSYLTKPGILIFLIYFILHGVEKSKVAVSGSCDSSAFLETGFKDEGGSDSDVAQKPLRKDPPNIVSFFKPGKKSPI